MKAYKALNPDLTSFYGNCSFELGKKYSVKGLIQLCINGFHACMDVRDVFYYYTWNSRIFEVEIEDDIIQRAVKIVGRNCTLIREIIDEVKSRKGMDLEAVKRKSDSIQYMENPSEEVQLAAVKQEGWAIQFIENPTEKLKLAAVNQNGYAIQYIKNPSEELQMAAVKQNGLAIQYIKNPSEAVQVAAVKQNGYAISCIKKPSEEVQLAAVNQEGWAIQYIKNPSEKVKSKAKEIQEQHKFHYE